jgi:hypothetical protein
MDRPTAPLDLDRLFGHPCLDTVLPRFEEYLRDVDGRPLGEANAPEAARTDVTFLYRRCPYPGSRRDRTMNMSALAPLVAAWDEVLALMLALRSAFMARYPAPMNHLLLARMAGFFTHYPGWLVRSGRVGWNAVPRAVSGLFKAAQGLFFTANDAMLEGGPAMAFAPVTVEAFLERTEARDIFRIDERVCAGPPGMVRRFVRAAIEGEGAGPVEAAGPPGSHGLEMAIRYAELRLSAQQVQRACSLALALGIDRAEGMPAPDLDAAVAEFERQAGSAGPAVSAAMRAGVSGLLRPAGRVAPAAAAALAEICAALWSRHVRFCADLQARIDPTLGRPPGATLDQQGRLALLAALGEPDLCARADAYLDLAGLARLMDRETAAGPATSPRR